MVEAKSQYQIVVDEYIKRGKMREAGDVLKKMADIDPADLKIRSKLADLYTRDGNSGKAVEEHVAIADELTKKGHLAEALQVLEKGLKIDAKSGRLRPELARIHLVQKNYDKAVHVPRGGRPAARPNDPEVMIAWARPTSAPSGSAEAEAIFKRLLEIDPNDQDSPRPDGAGCSCCRASSTRPTSSSCPSSRSSCERKRRGQGGRPPAADRAEEPGPREEPHQARRGLPGPRRRAPSSATYSQLTEAYINQGQIGRGRLGARDPRGARAPERAAPQQARSSCGASSQGGAAGAPRTRRPSAPRRRDSLRGGGLRARARARADSARPRPPRPPAPGGRARGPRSSSRVP